MARRKSGVPDASLFADEELSLAQVDEPVREYPYWHARTLSGMVFGERHRPQGGPYRRTEIEDQLRKVLRRWARFVDADVGEITPALLAEFEALFRKH